MLLLGVVFILRKIMSLCGTFELNILLPEFIPSVRFNKAAQMQNPLAAISIPPHTATAQTCFYNAFASCFNGAATNRQVASKEISVAHFILITHKISFLYRQFFLTTFRQISRIIGHQTQNGLCSVAVLKKLLAIFIVPDVARIVTFAKQRFAGFREMFGCMIKIYQFFVVIVYRIEVFSAYDQSERWPSHKKIFVVLCGSFFWAASTSCSSCCLKAVAPSWGIRAI